MNTPEPKKQTLDSMLADVHTLLNRYLSTGDPDPRVEDAEEILNNIRNFLPLEMRDAVLRFHTE